MSLSQSDIERVVQEVLRRLAAMSPSPLAPPVQNKTLSISGRLLTTADVKDRLQGISQVEVGIKTVVTPAVRDLLRERGVQLVKKSH